MNGTEIDLFTARLYQFTDKGLTVTEGKRGPKPVDAQSEPERLYSEIGRLKMELDWLKKKSGMSLS